MIVVGVKDSFNLGLAGELKADFIEIKMRRFPDGEICPRMIIEDGSIFKEAKVILSHRLRAGEGRPNDYLIEVIFASKRIIELGANEVYLVMPYLVYMRQDEPFRIGEPFSAKYVLKILHSSGIRKLFTVTAHFHRRRNFKELYEGLDAYQVSGFPALARYVSKKYTLKDPFILAPDEEAIVWAKEFADIVGGEAGALKKIRDLDTGEIKTIAAEYNLEDRDVVVVDDIVSTGGTMRNALLYARKRRAHRIYSCFVHPVLAGNALEKIKDVNPDDIVATDTLIWDRSKVSILPDLLKLVKREVS